MNRNAILSATVALATLATPALAADMPAPTYEPMAPVAPVPPTAMWSGFYAGGHLGYAFGRNRSSILVFDTTLDGNFNNTVTTGTGANAFGPGFASDFDGGIDVGARVGYDWQFANGFVVGALADISYTDVQDSTTGFSTTPAFYTFERDLKLFSTIRGRLGMGFENLLVYGTGGLAYGRVDHTIATDSPAPIIGARGGDKHNWGYTVGAGAEMLLTENLSVGLEYLYTDLGKEDAVVRFAGPGAPGGPFGAGTDMKRSDSRFDFHTVRVNMNYRFNTW